MDHHELVQQLHAAVPYHTAIHVQPVVFSSFERLGISPSHAASHSTISASRHNRLLLNTRLHLYVSHVHLAGSKIEYNKCI
jgi:hypothetical protein